MESGRSEITGSARRQPSGAASASLPSDQQLTVTVVLKPKPGSAAVAEQLLSGTFHPSSHANGPQALGADPAGVEAVENFARLYLLQVIESDAGRRTVKLSGSVRHLDEAFGVQLARFGDHISYRGSISVPSPLANYVLAVLGLDTNPVARSRTSPSPAAQ